MGSILGGGGGSSSAAKKASQGVANAITDASQSSAESIIQGSQTAADAQREARDYLMQADKLPSGLREAALRDLGSLYGMSYGKNGAVSSGAGGIIDRAMASPMYKAAVEQGEDAVLRNASATGGLRSGSASENLARVNQNALISSYQDQIAGLSGLSSLPSNANNIAGYTAGIGNTLGQGQISSANTLSEGQIAAAQALGQGQTASAQAKAAGSQNAMNSGMSLVGMGLTAAMMFSDRRLKKDIRHTGTERGIRKYSWTWNKLANALGMSGSGFGVMADEVEETHPDAVSIQDGYLMVDYDKLGVSYGV